MSIIIVVVLALGIFAGNIAGDTFAAVSSKLSSVMLAILMFTVGIDMGLNKDVFLRIKKLGFRILAVPAGVIIGSLLGGAVLSIFISEGLRESLAISSGLGWYSLSGILITEAGNPSGGAISFLSNVFREILTFVVVPFISRHLNYYCAIAPGGATAMDTTLPIISRFTDGKTAVVAFVSGITLTMCVPALIGIFI